MFPLGKETKLKIEWNKEKLTELYEMEEIVGSEKILAEKKKQKEMKGGL